MPAIIVFRSRHKLPRSTTFLLDVHKRLCRLICHQNSTHSTRERIAQFSRTAGPAGDRSSEWGETPCYSLVFLTTIQLSPLCLSLPPIRIDDSLSQVQLCKVKIDWQLMEQQQQTQTAKQPIVSTGSIVEFLHGEIPRKNDGNRKGKHFHETDIIFRKRRVHHGGTFYCWIDGKKSSFHIQSISRP